MTLLLIKNYLSVFLTVTVLVSSSNNCYSNELKTVSVSNSKSPKQIRAIFDESSDWMIKGNAVKIIERIKTAGFNTYIPCVWHGKGTRYPSQVAPPEKRLSSINDNEDPLKFLIQIAHQNSIEVHPWFTISKRGWNNLNDFYDPFRTPKNAYDLHRPIFRKFIVDLVTDVVKRYNIDGINLDYVRTRGICSCDYCTNQYYHQFKRNLLEDKLYKNNDGSLEKHLQIWQDQDVDDIIKRISFNTKKLKPQLIISVDANPKPSFFPKNPQGRNSLKWANNNWIDYLFVMEYGRNVNWGTLELVKDELLKPTKLIPLFGNFERNENGQIHVRDIGQIEKQIYQSEYENIGFYLYKLLNEDQISFFKNLFKKSSIARTNQLYDKNIYDVYNQLGPHLVVNFDNEITTKTPIVEFNGGEIIDDGIYKKAIRLKTSNFFSIESPDILNSDTGTVMFWVRPHWDYDIKESHTFLSYTWDNTQQQYFVISDGWWEHAGGGRFTYFIFNNKNKLKNRTVINYQNNNWYCIGYSWNVNKSNSINFFVNNLYLKQIKFKKIKSLSTKKIIFGSDLGVPLYLRKNRWANCDIDELVFFSKDLSFKEMAIIYKTLIENENNYEN